MYRLSTLFSATFLFLACQSENSSEPKIVGGKESQKGYPFFASLYDSSDLESTFCGASLLSEKLAITAAHCVSENYEQLSIKLPGGEFSSVQAVSVHPEFNSDTFENDIALVYFETEQTKLNDTNFVTIQTDNFQQVIADTARVIGYGNQTSFGSLFDSKLREVDVEIFNMSICNEVYEDASDLTNVCAGSLSGGRDSCQGDSGGPLFQPTLFGPAQLLGLVSYGLGCAQAGSPGVYTKVSAFKDWIEQEKSFYESLDNFSKKTFQAFVTRFCYRSLTHVSVIEEELGQLYLYDDINLDIISSTSSLSPRGKTLQKQVEEIDACAFELANGKKGELVWTKQKDNEDFFPIYRTFAKINTSWYEIETAFQRSTNFECLSTDYSALSLFFDDQNQEILYFQKADLSAYTEKLEQAPGTQDLVNFEASQCSFPNSYSFELYENPHQSFVKLTVADQTQWFYSEWFANDKVTAKVRPIDIQTLDITLEAITDDVIYSWQLSCSFEFEILIKDERVYKSTTNDFGIWSVRADYPQDELAKLTDPFDFRLSLVNASVADIPDGFCSFNEIPVDFELAE